MTRGLQLYNKLFVEEDPNFDNKKNLDLSIFGGCVLYAAFMSMGSKKSDEQWNTSIDWMVAAFKHVTKDGLTLDIACKSFAVESNTPYITDNLMETIRAKGNNSWLSIIRAVGLRGAAGQPRRSPDVISNLFIHIQAKFQSKAKKRTVKKEAFCILSPELVDETSHAFQSQMATNNNGDKLYAANRLRWLNSWKRMAA